MQAVLVQNISNMHVCPPCGTNIIIVWVHLQTSKYCIACTGIVIVGRILHAVVHVAAASDAVVMSS